METLTDQQIIKAGDFKSLTVNQTFTVTKQQSYSKNEIQEIIADLSSRLAYFQSLKDQLV